MLLFIDCEWDDDNLISMAIVPNSDEPPFYEVLHYKSTSIWIDDNVIPVLNKSPISKPVFQVKLNAFLKRFTDITIIADWPEDIMHFCLVVTYAPLQTICPVKIKFIVDGDLFSAESKIPHNALSDAESIKTYYIKNV